MNFLLSANNKPGPVVESKYFKSSIIATAILHLHGLFLEAPGLSLSVWWGKAFLAFAHDSRRCRNCATL